MFARTRYEPGSRPMTPAHVVKARLAAQGISSAVFAEPSEVVARLCAVQAQDYLGSLWAIGLRLNGACEQGIERAIANRSIVRTWPVRGTLHFVAAADARWLLDLLGPKMITRTAGRLRALGLDDATLGRAKRALVKRLEGGRALTRTAAYETLERAKVCTAEQRGLHVLWRLAHESILCFGPREGKQQTFVLLDEWLPRAKRLPREEALAELARRYFAGHGPASVVDFTWWSGLKLSEARLAVHLAGHALDTETEGGRTLLFTRLSMPSSPPRSRAFLLPAFDEFMVGYADRSAALEPGHKTYLNAGGGILNPIVVVDGRVVGTWKRRLVRGEVLFSSAPFAALGKSKTQAVAVAVQRYAEFLGVAVPD